MSSAGVQIGNNVSIDASGDATFSGTLSAAGGTFSGQLVIGGSATSLSSSDLKSALSLAKGDVGLGNVANKDEQNQASVCSYSSKRTKEERLNPFSQASS